MKKTLSVFMLIVLVFTFAGCSSNSTPKNVTVVIPIDVIHDAYGYIEDEELIFAYEEAGVTEVIKNEDDTLTLIMAEDTLQRMIEDCVIDLNSEVERLLAISYDIYRNRFSG